MLSIINYMNQSSSEKYNTAKDGRDVSSFLNDNQPPKLFIKITFKNRSNDFPIPW